MCAENKIHTHEVIRMKNPSKATFLVKQYNFCIKIVDETVANNLRTLTEWAGS